MGDVVGEIAEKGKISPGIYVPLLILALCCIGLGLLYLPEFRGVVLKPAALALQEGSEYTKLVLGL
jgi:hypothetical protein